MRKPVFFIAMNGALLLLVFCFLMQSLVIVQMIGTADIVQGTVEVQRRGRDWQPLTAKQAVHAFDVVRTGSASLAELRWRDGTRLRLGPATTLTIEKFAQHAVAKSQTSLFDLAVGKVWVRVVQALEPSSRFEIETPTAVAAVHGTIFSVGVENGETSVSVFEGTVNVRDRQHRELAVEAGRGATISSSANEQHLTDAVTAREWERQERIVGPALLLEEPSALMAAVSANSVRLRGYVEPGATLTINGVPVRPKLFGEFSHRVALQPGRNSLTLVATDRHGRQTLSMREIVRTTGQ